MPSKLDRYHAKRDFSETPEPSGAERESGGLRFVIQEHSARRLHWDLRLEHDGVAASWAVPNGIPDDPTENRKAIHTEDHPLEYLDFEGDIPKGSYGAGTMRIWDSGTYDLHKWNPREVILTFRGERVNGRYALFQAGRDEKDWLIHRMDPAIPRDPMPASVVPMLARAGTLPRDERHYGFEVKWDGVRAIAYLEPGRLRLEGRRLNDITAQYPEVHPLVRAVGARTAVLDGEIVSLDRDGRPSFERLQQRMHLTGEAQIRRRARDIPVTYMIFDVLYLDGRSLLSLPYEQRRGQLDELGLGGAAWRTPPSYPGEGRALLVASEKQGLEGVVAKRLGSRYEPGRRTGAWIKVKNKRSVELVVGGWMPGKGGRSGSIGALLLGYRDADGKLRYAGRAGSGLSEGEIGLLEQLFEPLARDSSPFERGSPPRGARFVEPRLVAEVEFTDWTKEGILRHPTYKGLREDADPDAVVLPADDEETGLAGESPVAAEVSLGPLRPLQRGAVEATVDGRTLRLTNLDKVLYPKSGFTKGDLIDYYVRVAPALLPHLHGRPLTLKRYPDGVDAQFFYEKQCPSHRPEWVHTHAIFSRQNRRDIEYCVVDDVPTLVWLGNLADLELHTSMSLAEDIEHPTMMVFDLDPGPPADLVDCCRVALWLRDILDPLGLESFPKTSGSKGLQVYVPLNSGATYDDTKPFAKAVAELLEKQNPDSVVSRMTKELRPGKVLVDWSQNDEHKTTVCVYSPRARERPTVSTPVRFDEVERCLADGDAGLLVFDVRGVLERVARDGDLFAPTLTLVQGLPRF